MKKRELKITPEFMKQLEQIAKETGKDVNILLAHILA